jgi:hypothetical protein
VAGSGGMLRAALAYARLGWPVFPCRPGEKVPATHGGGSWAASLMYMSLCRSFAMNMLASLPVSMAWCR